MTKYYEYNNENGTPGNALPNSENGPYFIEYSYSGTRTYQSDSIRSVYGQIQTTDLENSHEITCPNPAGTYGTAWSTITLVAGVTYYFGGFFKFEEISSEEIWRGTYNFDKLIYFYTHNDGWCLKSGFCYLNHGTPHVYGFTVGCAQANPFKAWHDGNEDTVPNVGSYNASNPPYCELDKWYAAVIGIKMATGNTGSVSMWINGNLTTYFENCPTLASGDYLTYFHTHSTIAQGSGGSAPAHKRQFDNLILTTSWSDIQAAGLDQDPEEGSSTPPSLTGVRIIGGSIR
jgi:hypothetical protein